MLGAPSFEYCNVAIASPDKAVEATRKCLGKSRAPSGSCRQPKLLRWVSRLARSNQHEHAQEAPFPLCSRARTTERANHHHPHAPDRSDADVNLAIRGWAPVKLFGDLQ